MSYCTLADLYEVRPRWQIIELTNDQDIIALVNGALIASVDTVVYDGEGELPIIGANVRFGNHNTVYTITALPTATSFKISPALTKDIADNETIIFQNQPNMTVVNKCIEKAEGDINSILRARYSLPLASIPPELTNLCARLAVDAMYERRGGMKGDILEWHNLNMAELKDYAKGVRQLDTTSEASSINTVKSSESEDPTIFTSDILDGYFS